MAADSNASGSTAVVLNRDLMFGSRLRSTLTSIGMTARFVPTSERFVATLNELGEACAIGIVDMNGAVDWTTIRDGLQSSDRWPPLLAFGPHVDAEKMRAAKDAGVTRVVSNGQFNRDMTALIERYRRSR